MISKHYILAAFLAATVSLPLRAQDNAALGVLEEKVNKLRAELEDLQFRQQKTDKAIEAIQADLKELRRNATAVPTTPTVTPEDLKTLETKISALDAARQKDNKAIIDELAKQLAALGSGKPPKLAPNITNNHNTNATANTANATEHIVQKGETLTAIAKLHGITVGALRKANNLASDSLAIGQKLVVPQKAGATPTP
jgi:LysM repeat protein